MDTRGKCNTCINVTLPALVTVQQRGGGWTITIEAAGLRHTAGGVNLQSNAEVKGALDTFAHALAGGGQILPSPQKDVLRLAVRQAHIRAIRSAGS